MFDKHIRFFCYYLRFLPVCTKSMIKHDRKDMVSAQQTAVDVK